MKTITADQITFTLLCEYEDDMPYVGNCMASGDPKLDRRAENWIRRQLENGNEWAWCRVELRGEFMGIEESEYLGGCSYKSEADFVKNSGYYDDMKAAIVKAINARAAEIAEAVAD